MVIFSEDLWASHMPQVCVVRSPITSSAMAPKRKATPAKAKKPASKAPSPAAARSSADPTPRKGKAAPAAGKRRKVDTRAAQPGAELTDSEEDEAPRLLSSFPDMGDSDSEEDEAAAASGGAAFSDANKDWLKPARTAGEDSEDDSSSDDGAGDDFAADGDDDEMDIERQSRLLDAQMAEEAEEAVEEVKEALARDVAEARQSLKLPRLATAPTATTAAAGAEGSAELEDELEEEGGLPPPAVLKERITDVVEVLSDFKTRRDPDLSRAEYMEQLARDMAEYYGYLRELIDLFLRMFSPAECVEFLEASERPRPVVIRTNTLKTRRKDLAEVSSIP
jgi:25S rRNA (cytosine2870-C5)-methyltransferase